MNKKVIAGVVVSAVVGYWGWVAQDKMAGVTVVAPKDVAKVEKAEVPLKADAPVLPADTGLVVPDNVLAPITPTPPVILNPTPGTPDEKKVEASPPAPIFSGNGSPGPNMNQGEEVKTSPSPNIAEGKIPPPTPSPLPFPTTTNPRVTTPMPQPTLTIKLRAANWCEGVEFIIADLLYDIHVIDKAEWRLAKANAVKDCSKSR